MEYETALSKSWNELEKYATNKEYTVQFLADEYTVNTGQRKITSLSCNIPAKAHTGILILHFLVKKLLGLPSPEGAWMSFKELTGGEGYYPTFKKRVLDVIKKKYETRNEEGGDISTVLNTFEGVSVLIRFWSGDDEFGPECNLLFDRSVARIFCTEDIVVLAEMVAHSI